MIPEHTSDMSCMSASVFLMPSKHSAGRTACYSRLQTRSTEGHGFRRGAHVRQVQTSTPVVPATLLPGVPGATSRNTDGDEEMGRSTIILAYLVNLGHVESFEVTFHLTSFI